MEIKTKEVIILNSEDIKIINNIRKLMSDILELTTDPDIYSTAKRIIEGVYDFKYYTNIEEE